MEHDEGLRGFRWKSQPPPSPLPGETLRAGQGAVLAPGGWRPASLGSYPRHFLHHQRVTLVSSLFAGPRPSPSPVTSALLLRGEPARRELLSDQPRRQEGLGHRSLCLGILK